MIASLLAASLLLASPQTQDAQAAPTATKVAAARPAKAEKPKTVMQAKVAKEQAASGVIVAKLFHPAVAGGVALAGGIVGGIISVAWTITGVVMMMWAYRVDNKIPGTRMPLPGDKFDEFTDAMRTGTVWDLGKYSVELMVFVMPLMFLVSAVGAGALVGGLMFGRE